MVGADETMYNVRVTKDERILFDSKVFIQLNYKGITLDQISPYMEQWRPPYIKLIVSVDLRHWRNNYRFKTLPINFDFRICDSLTSGVMKRKKSKNCFKGGVERRQQSQSNKKQQHNMVAVSPLGKSLMFLYQVSQPRALSHLRLTFSFFFHNSTTSKKSIWETAKVMYSGFKPGAP